MSQDIDPFLERELAQAHIRLAAGELEEAAAGFRAVVEAADAQDRHRLAGEAHFGLAEVYGRIDQGFGHESVSEDRERIHAERALRAFTAAGDADGRLKALARLAIEAALDSQLKLATFYVGQITKLDAAGRDFWAAYAGAHVFRAAGAVGDGERAFERALALATTLGPNQGPSMAQQCQRQLAGSYLFETGRLDDARASFERLLESAEAADDLREVVRCALALAIVGIGLGNLALARACLARAVAGVETQRAVLASPENQRRISKTTAPMYQMLVSTALKRGEVAFAFEAVEMNRARAIRNQLAAHSTWHGRPAHDLERYAEVAQREAECFAELRSAAGSERSAAGDAPEPLMRNWHATLKTRRKLLHELEERASVGARSTPVTEATLLERLRVALPADSAAVLYHLGKELSAFVVTSDGLEHVASGLGSGEVLAAAAELRRRIVAIAGRTGRPAIDRELRELDTLLHRALVAPVEPRVAGRSRVHLIPSAGLWSLPIHALGLDRCLAVGHQVAYCFGGAVLLGLLGRAALVSRPPAFLGVADADGTLAQAREEVERSARFFGRSVVLSGREATARAVRAALEPATVVHFACHGFYLDEYPEFSFLELAPAEGEDSRLDVASIAHESLGADLVVLSACHSGRGTSYPGDEFVGFPSAFLAAGARSVLGSLWNIDDVAARAFMDEFYPALGAGSAGEAFRSATRALARTDEWAHPYFWGAFQLFGALA